MIADLYDISGKLIKKINIPKEIFGVKASDQLLAQSIRVYLNNQRQAGTASSKPRNAVIGSTRKIHKQKGTGKARHGDRKAPIFVGGGKAHGPTGKENYKLKLTKKMRKKAILAVLSTKFTEKNIIFIQGQEKIKTKTKEVVQMLNNLKLLNKRKKLEKTTLLVLSDKEDKLILASPRIAILYGRRVKQLNAYQLLKSHKLIISNDSLSQLKELFSKKTIKRIKKDK